MDARICCRDGSATGVGGIDPDPDGAVDVVAGVEVETAVATGVAPEDDMTANDRRDEKKSKTENSDG